MPDEDDIEEIEELIGLADSTVSEIKQYVRENNPEEEQLRKLLKIEKDTKQRKTAIDFLENQLENDEKEVQEESIEAEELDREELLEILGGTVEDMKEWVKEKDPSDEQLQEILHAEKIVNDRKTAVDFLKSYSKKKDLKEDIKKTEEDFKELRKDLDEIESEVLDDDIDLAGIEPEEIEDNESDDEETEEPEEDKAEESQDEEESEEKEEETEEKSNLEQKKELAEELDAEMSEEELEDITLEELQRIRDEKAEREELIDELEDEFDEEELRNASTDDLRNLKQSMEEQETEEDTEEKEDEEIREEAEEDLEMLMGAVKSDEGTEEEDKDWFEGLKNLRSNLKGRLGFLGSGDEEEESKGMEPEDVIELLEEYRELESHEAAIKTAHIMKGYLEFTEGIDRELLYSELSEEIESEDENMERLLEFFDRMSKDQYTGNISENIDEVINAAEEVVEMRG